jgi:predicted AAA+ superfamily ATPase
MYPRLIEDRIVSGINSGKVLIIYGPRQVGKTTLAKKVAGDQGQYLYLNCDEPDVRLALTDRNSSELKRLIGDYSFVVIDEAQRVSNIGLTLKIIIDSKLTKTVLATGSSSFDLANKVSEPLTGRKIVFTLLPLTYNELSAGMSSIERERLISELAVFGSYPDVAKHTAADDKKLIMRELTDSSLYKDILEFQKIRNPNKIRDLLRALAFQIGSEVSYSELGQQLALDRQTIESYINLLEQSFILFRLPPLTLNPRKEISRLKKIYFYDNGLRNSLINRFEDFRLHPDRGPLWESWAITDRIKSHIMNGDPRLHYFWRLKSGAEIDLVEEVSGRYQGIELKSNNRAVRAPDSWRSMYPGSTWDIVQPQTYDESSGRLL